jgi:antitoxin (DNA-binding transcriptional repressor) of toxin-antitoxin stability system
MVSRIPISEARDKLDQLVERVSAGEEFVLERGGIDVCRLGPAAPQKVLLGRDLAALIDSLPKPDDGFFEDVESFVRNQQNAPPPPVWE